MELRLILSLLDGGRYSSETITDFLQTRPHRALLFTDRRILMYNCQRNYLVWQIPLPCECGTKSRGN